MLTFSFYTTFFIINAVQEKKIHFFSPFHYGLFFFQAYFLCVIKKKTEKTMYYNVNSYQNWTEVCNLILGGNFRW